VALARVDEQHLTSADLTALGPVIEQQASACHDERDRDRVAVLGHALARQQTQADDAHRTAIRDLLEPERAWSVACSRHGRQLNIVHATGIEGARQARGTVVVIDVLRAFTVSAYALGGGALECRLVRTVAEAKGLAASIKDAVISAEEDALPVEGIAISNSPSRITQTELRGKILIQRSTAGTQCAAAAKEADDMFAASLVVARATAQACLLRDPATLTLVASADHPEDHACADYIEGLIRGQKPDLDRLLQPLREAERYRKAMSGDWPGFPPTDLDLALQTDRFEFAMPITRAEGFLRVTASRP
jgi:2-phosphosulfolactate phosphatase